MKKNIFFVLCLHKKTQAFKDYMNLLLRSEEDWKRAQVINFKIVIF